MDTLHRLPAGIPPEKGALSEPLAVGVHAANMGEARPEERILVVGAGPIGLITALCLRRKGVRHMLLSDVCDFRLKLAAELGFDVIDARSESVTERVMALTDGDGADAVYEVSGHESAMPELCVWPRVRGKIIFVSVHKEPRLMDFRSVNFKELTILGSRCYRPDEFGEAVAALAETPVERLISHRMPLAEGPAGFEAMKNADISCKVLFQP